MVFHAHDRTLRLALLIGFVAVAVRFIAINQPFVDDWSWRQSDVAAIARNFFLHGFHFAYPQIDWAGGEPGYVGTEFPILPFLAALAYRFVGLHEWVGRIQAVLLFATSLPFFFLLVRRLADDTAAVWALLFYSFAPLQLMASRCFMPDVPSLSLSIVGLYFFFRWTESDRLQFFAFSALAICLAILIKIPTALIGVPLAVLAFSRFGVSAFRRGQLWLFGVIALLPSALWYWHAHQISKEFYPHHFFGAGGFEIKTLGWYLKIVRFTLFSSLTLVFSAMAAAGVFVSWAQPARRLILWWGGAMILFIIAAGYGNRHPWYQLPLVPIAAVLAGVFCSAVAHRYREARLMPRAGGAVLIVAFAFLSFASARLFYAEHAAKLGALGLQIKASTPPDALIVAPDYGDPTVFYYAERKGWHFLEKNAIYNGHPVDSAMASADLENLRKRGATHIVFYADTLWWLVDYKEFAHELDQTCAIVINTPQFRIYRLPGKPESTR
jgi:4-amino-4-deoxy-L-arabinose transferase-like glycosyltransferase